MMTDSVTAKQAENLYLSVVGQTNQEDMVNAASQEPSSPIVRMAYLQIGGEMRPVWVCAPDYGYGNHIFIDMYTGERLSI